MPRYLYEVYILCMIYNDFNIKMYIFLSLEVIRGSQIMETAPRCCCPVTVPATACLVNYNCMLY